MHRTFRTPIIPALQGVTRARMYGSSTKASQTLQVKNEESKKEADQLKIKLKSELNQRMMSEAGRIKKKLNDSSNMNDMRNLVAVHELMQIYRKYRDEVRDTQILDNKGDTASIDTKEKQEDVQTQETSTRINASEPIHAILTTLRIRQKILKPVISDVRKQILSSQNEILAQYLDEIADDLVAGRSYTTRFGITYMITAFYTMNKNSQATQLWKRLSSKDDGAVSKDISSKMSDPRVIAAAMRSSDPELVKLEELEDLHKKTTEQHGRYMLADESLAVVYLNYGDFNKSVEVFSSICEHYDLAEWHDSIVRLHNQILTQTTDMNIAKTFFDTATADESFVQLHPSAAARYIKHLYDATEDPVQVVEAYEKAMNRLRTQKTFSYEITRCINTTSEVMKALVHKHYALEGATPEAKDLIDRVIAVNNDPICVNTVLSYVYKAWPSSDLIVDIHKKHYPDSQILNFDSTRVILSSCQALDPTQVTIEQVSEWWQRLISLKKPKVFDWYSLAKACDNTFRVNYFVDQWILLQPAGVNLNFEKFPIVRAAMVSRGLNINQDYDSSFSADLVDSELAARDVARDIKAA